MYKRQNTDLGQNGDVMLHNKNHNNSNTESAESINGDQLHWLPVKQRVQYKLCTIMYAVHHVLAPSYITELITIV